LFTDPDQHHGEATHQHAANREYADRLVEEQEREHHRGRRDQIEE
jgi:hypothetical protein